jgi:glycerol-3-phosphate dehydrogenase
MSRSERLERLGSGKFDVLVIGAGVIGAATAWAAARAGAKVAVVDRGDVAGATSSASSKLLHGGLRYLRTGQIGLVREAHRERRLNAEVVAPHLVRPLPFLLSIGPECPYPEWQLRLGVFAYSALSRFRDGASGRVAVSEALRSVPGARTDERRFVRYFDHQTDDARLVLGAIRSAEVAGAVWLNHAEVTELRIEGGRVRGAEVRDVLGGEQLSIHARVVVNASGPWVDELRRFEDPAASPSVRLSKGVHLLLATDRQATAAVTSPLPEGRVGFALPWHGMLLLGTTDEPFDGPPGSVTVTAADVAQVLREAGTSLTPEAVRPELVRSSFAGLRVLPLGGAGTAAAPRETVITTGSRGMLSVAGGKLTTWRRIGVRVAAQALEAIGEPGPDGVARPILGAARAADVAATLGKLHPDLGPVACLHMASTYGSLAAEVLAPTRENPDLYEPIVPGAPDLMAQVPYAFDWEGACTAEDVLRRRTTLAIRGLSDLARPRIEPFLAVTPLVEGAPRL